MAVTLAAAVDPLARAALEGPAVLEVPGVPAAWPGTVEQAAPSTYAWASIAAMGTTVQRMLATPRTEHAPIPTRQTGRRATSGGPPASARREHVRTRCSAPASTVATPTSARWTSVIPPTAPARTPLKPTAPRATLGESAAYARPAYARMRCSVRMRPHVATTATSAPKTTAIR